MRAHLPSSVPADEVVAPKTCCPGRSCYDGPRLIFRRARELWRTTRLIVRRALAAERTTRLMDQAPDVLVQQAAQAAH